MDTAVDPLPTCRRKALWFGAFGVAMLLLAWAAHAADVPVERWVHGVLTGFGAGGVLAAGLLWWLPDNSDAAPKQLTARYHREMWPAMAAYVITVLAWKRTLHLFEATWLRVLFALLPALCVLAVMTALLRLVGAAAALARG